jgi:hypothetical protein
MPEGYSIYATEGILTEKAKVAVKNTEDWADYVFKPTYKRLSLEEVGKFIAINNHLPNVPSAAEMVANGNDLHKTDVKLLEKIEELTLYMLELKKRDEANAKEIQSLKQQVVKLRKNRK